MAYSIYTNNIQKNYFLVIEQQYETIINLLDK